MDRKNEIIVTKIFKMVWNSLYRTIIEKNEKK